MPALTKLIRVTRWPMLLLCVAAGLYFLNDAFFSAWIAGGPPGEHKLGWERRSQASLALSASCFLAGIGVFRIAGKYPDISRKVWLLLSLAACLALAPILVREVLVDKCLDGGGRWNSGAIECEY
jgi:hypothetical protein